MIEVPGLLRTYYARWIKDEPSFRLAYRYDGLIKAAVAAKAQGLPEEAYAGLEAKAILIRLELKERGHEALL